jgi:hypothetical protein
LRRPISRRTARRIERCLWNFASRATWDRLGRPPAHSLTQRSRAQRAYLLARPVDPHNEPFYSRIYADVVLAATQDPGRGEEMFKRLAVALEVAADRVNWPHSIIGL